MQNMNLYFGNRFAEHSLTFQRTFARENMFPLHSTLSAHSATESFTMNRYAGAWSASQKSMISYIQLWVGSIRIFRTGYRQLIELRMFRISSASEWDGGCRDFHITIFVKEYRSFPIRTGVSPVGIRLSSSDNSFFKMIYTFTLSVILSNALQRLRRLLSLTLSFWASAKNL